MRKYYSKKHGNMWMRKKYVQAFLEKLLKEDEANTPGAQDASQMEKNASMEADKQT